jgi:Flp pilus assembly pilin Flp
MLDMLMTYVRSYVKNETGQAMVEYALILALVSIFAIATLKLVGTDIDNLLKKVDVALQ